MIIIFDFFETLLNSKSIDFNRGLYEFWSSYYKDKCPFEDMKAYGEKLFRVLLSKHKEGEEYPDGEDGEEPSTDGKQDSDVIIKA